jgi:hypothetical protein
MTEALKQWEDLVRFVNSAPPRFGAPGVRDPDYPCEVFDGDGYNGRGDCLSDGHYLCEECSHLSPKASRFGGIEGRSDRLLLFWGRKR